ncbi:MAG: hypothetical protein AB7O56_08270 [Bauldia sp.]
MQTYERRYGERWPGVRMSREHTITISRGWLIFILGFIVGAFLL